MKYRKSLLAALVAPVLAFSTVATVHAAGYAVFTHGASALGQGNAVTAHGSDPSTIFYNPALINKLEGTQVQLGTTAIFSSREYQSSLPEGADSSNNQTFFPSTFYATLQLNDKVTVGLGVFNPFGLGTDWDDDWDGRYLATESELTTFNINPVLSYQVTPALSMAAGVDFLILDATLERKLPSGALAQFGYTPGVDLDQKFKGEGAGVGFNVAVAYDVCEHLALGASYRSQVKVNIDGEGTVSGASFLNSKGSTKLTLPPQFTAGVAFKGVDKLVLEAGLRWEGWSKFDDLTIKLDNGQTSVTPRDWKDAWGLNAGGRYQATDTVALLAGYVFGNSAVPDSTFDPSIPDAKTHVFCIGTDLNLRPFTVAASYAYQLYESRTKNNAIASQFAPSATADGKYDTDAHLVALSLGYKF